MVIASKGVLSPLLRGDLGVCHNLSNTTSTILVDLATPPLHKLGEMSEYE